MKSNLALPVKQSATSSWIPQGCRDQPEIRRCWVQSIERSAKSSFQKRAGTGHLLLARGCGERLFLSLPVASLTHRPEVQGTSCVLFPAGSANTPPPARATFPGLSAGHRDAAFFSIRSCPPWPTLRTTGQCDIHTIGGCPPECGAMRKSGSGQLDSSRLSSHAPYTRSFSPQRWVRSRCPTHRGGDERALERGRACALATPVIRASLYGRHNGPRSRHQNAQQELPGSWPGHPQAERICVVSRRDNASGAGRVATAGGKATQQ
ncbi:hypothetical protein LMG28688_06096 [Paraburkholderia caffeinitolerans]|uniref:Uncharacterized protein n=1 Tax=Paraburkholderia caffeinitolerans TaxID=1723730 RepID=A0A6J5GT84_9BURK|nr:hypothetical protein LMG28688_06096 [Paraburkholderia caffeinitolerans]